jgi:hypothetical protein
MSIPYTSEDFTTPRAGGDSWVEYPFIEYGDNSSKVYHMRCTVNKDDYTAIALSTTMASASNADVLVLPFAADTSAYFVGDFNHRVKDGALIEFDRQFATIPATRTRELIGSSTFNFPNFQDVVYTAPATAQSATYSDNLWEYKNSGGGNNAPGQLYLTSNYYTESNIPSSLPNVFKPTLYGGNVDYVSNGGSGAFSNAVALNGETFTATYNVASTSPNKTSYLSSVTNGNFLIVDLQVERYIGNIYVVKKYEMKAQ